MFNGSSLAGITTHKNPKRMALDDVQQGALVYGDPIVIASGVTDSGHTGQTNTLRPGTVVVKKTGSTQFVSATDYANHDVGSVAQVDSAEAPDADWASTTITLYRNGVQVASVTLGGADDTVAEVVTALNADQAFAANAKAVANTILEVYDLLGNGDALRLESTLATAYATAGGAGSYAEAIGSVPDVRVLLEEVTMVDANGTATTGFSAENARKGHFKIADLVSGGTAGTIPASARGVLTRRGSTFVA